MTLTELMEEVYLITARPDLEAETKSAVKRATLKAHKSDYYDKDLYEQGIQFEESSYIQTFDPHAQWNNFRTWKYFKRVTNPEAVNVAEYTTHPIDIISVDELLDNYQAQRSDIAYIAGRNLEIRASVAFTKALVGIYALPIVTDTGYISWVAEQYPYVIIHEAARAVFAAIGKLEESREQRILAAEELVEMRSDSLTYVGS